MEILAIIPARGGSKGVPRKNIRLLCGKPLLAYSVAAAQESTCVTRIIVSTDDKEIAVVAEEAGAEVPFSRPARLARDETAGIEPVIHGIEWLRRHENYDPDLVVLLQPTSPLREARDIDEAVEMFQRQEAEAVVSVCLADHHPYWMKKLTKSGEIRDFMKEGGDHTRRQTLPPAYRLNGALYIATPKTLLKERTYYSKRTYAYIMLKERSVDIDDEIDFMVAESIMLGINSQPKKRPRHEGRA